MQAKSISSILFIALIIFENNIKLNLCKEKDNMNLYEALNIIIQQTFKENNSQLLFYSYFENISAGNHFYSGDIINGVLQRISHVSYKVFHQKEKLFFNLRHNEVILLDNIKAFRNFFHELRAIGNMDLARTLLFISSLTSLDYETLYLIFKDLYHMDMIRVALVVKLSANDIVMLTYFPFTGTACRDFKPVVINRYLTDKHRWENDNFFPSKLNDFHGCPVVCCAWKNMPFFDVKPDTRNSSVLNYVGLEAEVLNFAAKPLNLSIKIHWIDPIRGHVNNQDGFLAQIFSQHCDFALGGFIYKRDLDYASTFSQTNNIFPSHLYIVTNAIKSYTKYEKLAFPFHYTVWLTLGLICTLSSLLICTCERRRKWLRYRKFLMGSSNKTPHYNLYTLAVGANIAMTRLPKRNFARLLLTTWLLLTLVLRTAYQSGMYHMLRTNKRWNPPQTIENVFKENYVISTTLENRKYLSFLPNEKRVRILNTTIVEALSELLNDKEPIAVLTSFKYFGYFGKMHGSQWQHFHLVKERVLSQQQTIYVRHHSYLIPVLNDLLSDAQHFGFVARWNVQYTLTVATALKTIANAQTNSNTNSDKNPLSMNELGAIFMILVWLHVLAVVAFLIELMWHRCGALRNIA